MIIVKILGGLGNQMFQYAAAKALSLHLGQPIKHDLRGLYAGEDIRKTYELDIFGIEPEQALHKEYFVYQRKTILRSRRLQQLFLFFNQHVTIKDNDFVFIEDFFQIARPNTYLRGLFQSEKYFVNFRNQILNTFSFKEPLSGLNKEHANLMQKTESISIHIRRGEFANDKKYSAVIGSCNLDYYHNAIKSLLQKVKDMESLRFFVFSDDLKWAEENLKLEFPTTFVSGNTGKESYRDLQLMSICRHNVIANSTFSWWGAWLNQNPDKLVFAPSKWFAGWEHDTRDLIPVSWIKI
jgi:hypothetical protein